ncbi:rhodanese-like domain-containing protein [Pedosphaera parvula]|uniref:Rhodanese domain protein n=1 Tax=Pedosphaera parvula (strain Ellin514) TaxID=320771 RepID=B9XAB8_PEDPL|nr:Rhodanese domain protein [Pedosphaera parvula Ellin514]
MQTVSVQEAKNNARALLLDVRTPAEYKEVHTADALLRPLAELHPATLAELAANRPIYILCRTGNRARQAAERLQKSGVTDVAVIEGGIEAWQAAGLPVVRGRKTMSLERQVRIAAGALVLTGMILGFLLHPCFFVIPTFVGTGLILPVLPSGVAWECSLPECPGTRALPRS